MAVETELTKQNHCEQDEANNVGDGVVGEGQQDLSDEDKQRISRVAKDVKDGHEGAVLAQAVLQIPQQQHQGSMVCWERFLHLRSLKVLLVENDASTRHIVAALLRNCCYEVIEATNGLQAWKILEDLTNHIDLVLTEVTMPCVSGVALLCKIMSHKTRKNVPVIMMSSHDSMGLVFKCLSKGAVDFLLKPIRKNELKNLWQHVWRRCHSSSGSGSDSDTQTQKSVKSKSVEKSDNTGSSDEDDNWSNGLNVRDGSDNGSGTQGSWTKQAVELDSPQSMSPWDQSAECPDSTCGQVIHSKAETAGNKHVPMTAAMKCQGQKEQLDRAAMPRDLETGVPGNPDLQHGDPIKAPVKLVGTRENNLPKMDLNDEAPPGKLKCKSAKLICIVTDTTSPQMDSKESEARTTLSKISEINNGATNDSKESPSLKLSLNRLRGIKDTGTTVQDDHNVLKHSDLLAFSRYNTASNADKAPCENIRSGSPLDYSSEVVVKVSMRDILSHSNGDHPNHCSNGGSNTVDMSSINSVFTKPVNPKDKSVAASFCPLSPFQSMGNDSIFSPRQALIDKASDMETMTVLAQLKGTQQELQIQHLHHHYDLHNHLVHNMQQEQQLLHNQDDFLLKEMAAALCGSSTMVGGAVEGNARNYSLNGSASGSNHGSNGLNGSSTAVNAGGTNIESDDLLGGKSGSGEASGSGSGNRIGQNRSMQREAALTKFRQKRKERCFQKKVRYQSRKRLAEERPRVRGQFVRQKMQGNTSMSSDS